MATATDALPSKEASAEAKTYELKPAIKASNAKPGLTYQYFQPDGKIDMTVLKGTPITTGVVTTIGIDKKQRADRFAFLFEGYILITKDGTYTFSTESDDGSALYIDDDKIVNNGSAGGGLEPEGKAALKKGYHKIKLAYYDSGGGNGLTAFIQSERNEKQPIPASQLFH